jgi:hypothetical protein
MSPTAKWRYRKEWELFQSSTKPKSRGGEDWEPSQISKLVGEQRNAPNVKQEPNFLLFTLSSTKIQCQPQ